MCGNEEEKQLLGCGGIVHNIINNFENQVETWKRENPLLQKILEELAVDYGYTVENAVVFNKNLRKLSKSNPKYIVVADNPGVDEQKNKNSCYLIGKSGQMTRNFFLKNNLVSDFDEEVAVLNKSCIHTKKTGDLKKLKQFKELLDETQLFMANLVADIQTLSGCSIWIIGCSELKEKGIFETYLNQLKKRCEKEKKLKENLFFYPHFSYGNFQKRLNSVMSEHPGLTLKKCLKIADLKLVD